MLANDDGRFVPVLVKARLGREQAVFAPPVEHEVGTFAGKWAMEDLVAPIHAGDYRLASARIFELTQFLNDKVSQCFILRWFHDSGGFYPF